MSWERVTDEKRLTEWERSGGNATIRLRERPDGRYTVRFDRLHQAPGGKEYRHKTVATREAATTLAEEWQAPFDNAD